jgi:N-acetylglutamate synthase-like GNAT family acetyltransferase
MLCATPGVVMAIQSAAAADLAIVLDLLERSGLPATGLSDHLDTLLVAHDGERVVGSAALELYDDSALLRSVAVDAPARGSRVGQRLTVAALDLARQRGIRDVFLLTTTAETFFTRFGFEPVARTSVPHAVRQSVEFTSACPASAVVLRKHLEEP